MFTPRLSAYERQIFEERRVRLARMAPGKGVMPCDTIRGDIAPPVDRPIRSQGARRKPEPPTISPGLIRHQVMSYFGIDEEQLKSEKYGSDKKYVMARFLSMYLCVEYFPNFPKIRIAKMHGDRDHSTVYYALHVVRWCIDGVPLPPNVKTNKWNNPGKMAAMKAAYEAIKTALDAVDKSREADIVLTKA